MTIKIITIIQINEYIHIDFPKEYKVFILLVSTKSMQLFTRSVSDQTEEKNIENIPQVSWDWIIEDTLCKHLIIKTKSSPRNLMSIFSFNVFNDF